MPRGPSSYVTWNNTVCDVKTGGLTAKSKKEVNNYAYLVNRWLAGQRGGRVQIKKIKPRERYLSSQYTRDIRAANPLVFPAGQTGTQATVVGHVPDPALSGDQYPTGSNAARCS